MSHTLPLLELSISRQPHFSAKRELSKRDFYIYYQKSLLQGGVIWEFAEISTWIS